METLIKVGGVYNIILVVFHMLFWRIFNWGDDLRTLSILNKAVMQVLNISLIFVFVIFAYVSLAHSLELLTSPLGKSLLILMAVFWLIRSILQVVFFRLRHWGSVAFMVFFIAGAFLYGIPATYAI
jgi:hypothetical protein